MEHTKNFLSVLLSVFVLALWSIPMIMVHITGANEWGVLYILIAIIPICWGNVMYKHYYE